GIRDRTVTGVQTCALPICGRWPELEAHKFMDEEYFPVASPRFNRGRLPAHPAELGKFQLMRSNDEPWTPWFRAAGVRLKEPHSRSEERRVGKECRSRWAAK